LGFSIFESPVTIPRYQLTGRSKLELNHHLLKAGELGKLLKQLSQLAICFDLLWPFQKCPIRGVDLSLALP
jgi:hypothetical protein